MKHDSLHLIESYNARGGWLQEYEQIFYEEDHAVVIHFTMIANKLYNYSIIVRHSETEKSVYLDN